MKFINDEVITNNKRIREYFEVGEISFNWEVFHGKDDETSATTSNINIVTGGIMCSY